MNFDIWYNNLEKAGDTMLTQRFKIVLISFGAVLVAGGLTANQYILTKKVDSLENKAPEVIMVKESPTPTIPASPSATMKVSPSPKVTSTEVKVTVPVK